MFIVPVLILVAALCINGWFAVQARDAAEAKGYEGRKWFHLCFWLGLVPYLIVAALPDLVLRGQLEAICRSLPESAVPAQASRLPAQAAAAKKACPHCGAQNGSGNAECWVCHELL